MKNWQKIFCALALIGSMAATVAAEDVVSADVEADVVTTSVEVVSVELPTFVHAQQVEITSSMASDNSDLTVLYDLADDTTVTFAEADKGVQISMTTKEAFRLHSIVVNETETKYDAALYASKDGENWVEVKFDTIAKDGFVVYQAKALGRKYKFYRLEATTEEGQALSFHTLAMYEKVDDVWPFSLRQMFRAPAAQRQ